MQQFSAKILCNMDLAKYPADTQHCEMVFYSATNEAWTLVDENRINFTPFFDAGLFDVTLSHGLPKVRGRFGWAARTSLHITFKRKPMSVLISFVIPAMLINIISMSQFWMTVMPARVALAIISFLTMYSLKVGAAASLPQSGQCTAFANA